jgi:large conductance mechanosensitive channel
MSLYKEFKAFLNRGNVVDLAIAVVIGAAFGKIVSAIVSDLVMPLVNAILPQGDWRKWEATPLHFRVGDLMGTVVDFLIVAFVIFIVMVKLTGFTRGKIGDTPQTKACPECLETVPAAAKRCKFCTSVLTALALLFLLARPALAQGNPKFEYGKPDAAAAAAAAAQPPAVEWKAQMKGGLLVTSGNSQTRNATLGVSASRKADGNKLALEGGLAYGRSNILSAPNVDATNPDMPVINAPLARTGITTTNSWLAKGRYDRFFTANNSGYASAQGAADQVAGKSFYGGGQAGYSRQVLKDQRNLLVAELGYDFSYERYVQQPMKTLDPVSIHSARIFVGETLTLTPSSGLTASVEALLNLNKEGAALNVNTQMPGVDALHDTRVAGKLGLTSTLWKRLSLAFGLTVKYDQNPAPLPVPSSAPKGAAYAPGFLPFAEKLDTLTEANLIFTFL